jgi:methylated-DNA-[protein]-cysteine S-methyltransferase
MTRKDHTIMNPNETLHPSEAGHPNQPVDPSQTVHPSPLRYTTIESPIGALLLLSDGHALRGLYMQEAPNPATIAPDWEPSEAPFTDVKAQLSEYFAGRRTTFQLPLALEGTPFQRRVWSALQDIPYGETTSYGEIARRIDQPAAVRAVGLANGRNPISVIVPCHRVIGANGTLTGYGGGLERKRRLLELESDATAPRLTERDGALLGRA